jgi:hypothetical protein
MHLEDNRRLSLRGWALGADGGQGQLQLWLGGRPVAAEIQRVERPDVLAHLGRSEQSGRLRPGFEVELSAEVWREVVGSQDTVDGELRLDGEPALRFAWRMDDDELAAWARELIGAPPAQAGQERAWHRLAGFLSDAGGGPSPRWQWVWQAWAAQGGVPGKRADGRVEEIDGAVFTGWASDPCGRPEHFTVHCAGRTWPVGAARFERQDVAQALPTATPLAGFALSLPLDLWSTLPPQGATLQLCVNQRPLLVPPLALTTADLAQWLSVAQGKTAHALGDARHEAVQTLAVLRMHAVAAGLAEPATELADPQVDEDVAGLWTLQRAFNRQLGEAGATAITAWQALRGSPPKASVAAWRRFALSLVPAFCALNQLGILRAHLDPQELATMAHADGAWELSLLLPIAVMDELSQGRLTQGTALLGRIARALPAGWLNTESLADSVRRVRAAAMECALDDAELRAFVLAVRQVLDAIGEDAWSRSRDRFLVDAMVELLLLAEGVDEPLARDVWQAALQRHALEPDFWQRWWAEARALPPALGTLADAAAAWRDALEAFQRPAEGSPDRARWVAAWQALRPFEACGLSDLPLLRRHLLALAPQGDEAALGILPTELADADHLRLWPLGPGSADRWRALLPVPSVPVPALRERLVEAQRRWHDAAERNDVAALAQLWPGLAAGALQCVRLDSGFAGLPMLAMLWHGTARLPDLRAELARRLLAAAGQAMDMVDRRRHELGVPPAALLAALDWLQHGGLPDGPERCRPLIARLQAHWPAWSDEATLPWPADERIGATAVPGVSPLVVIRQAVGGEAAMRRIAAGLGATLSQRGIGWCVWQPAVVDSARGFAAVDLWQALDWLTSHTRAGHFCFVDDDVELSVDAWLAAGGATHHLHGVVLPADAETGRLPFVALGLGLGLSRAAAAAACRLARTRRGAHLRQRLSDDAAALAEVLHWLGVQPSAQAHIVHMRRPPEAQALPRLFHNAWPPGPGVPTVLTTHAPAGEAPASSESWGPARIWPPDQPPRLPGGAEPAQQLVRLSAAIAAEDGHAPCVIAVARNERVLLPHFLAHYRGLGVRRFFIADNLSDDGSREYLLQQPDVGLYSVDTDYRDSHYGVAWQMALLAHHAQRGWALVADIDEFLVWPGCEQEGMAGLCERLDAQGHDAAMALMVDMYPQGPLDEADFERTPPFEAAQWFDHQPVLPWRLGSGSFSQSGTWVSAVRHRLLPGSPPNHYTAQKLPLMRYRAGVRLSEGLHYAAGFAPATQPVFFAHFKYHRGFRAKVEHEVARRQHFNNAEEYRKYRALWAEARGMMFDPAHSRRYVDSHSFADLAWS